MGWIGYMTFNPIDGPTDEIKKQTIWQWIVSVIMPIQWYQLIESSKHFDKMLMKIHAYSTSTCILLPFLKEKTIALEELFFESQLPAPFYQPIKVKKHMYM